MASSVTLSALPKPSSPPPLRQGKGREAVYVAAVPLRATKGPPQILMSTAYSLGFWDLQHYMVIIKSNPSLAQALVFDFQPQDPENVYVALAALSGREVPGVVLKRMLGRLPKSRCWFVGFSKTDAVDVANKFNEDWSSSLIVGKHDCRHYTNDLCMELVNKTNWKRNLPVQCAGLVECLTGERHVLDYLRTT